MGEKGHDSIVWRRRESYANVIRGLSRVSRSIAMGVILWRTGVTPLLQRTCSRPTGERHANDFHGRRTARLEFCESRDILQHQTPTYGKGETERRLAKETYCKWLRCAVKHVLLQLGSRYEESTTLAQERDSTILHSMLGQGNSGDSRALGMRADTLQAWVERNGMELFLHRLHRRLCRPARSASAAVTLLKLLCF